MQGSGDFFNYTRAVTFGSELNTSVEGQSLPYSRGSNMTEKCDSWLTRAQDHRLRTCSISSSPVMVGLGRLVFDGIHKTESTM